MLRTRVVTASVLGGLLGGLAGAGAMSAAHVLVASLRQETAAPTAQQDDATVKVGDALSRLARGRSLAQDEKPAAGSAVHYGFGAVVGTAYGAVAASVPRATVGSGAAFGAAVWLGAHVLVVPALGLAPSPLRQPATKEGLELVLHLLYGVTVEFCRRVVLRFAR